jgi:hypothetical protein
LREPLETVTGRSDKPEADGQDVLFEVNAHVYEAATRFEGMEPAQDRWDFTCECGAPYCRGTVSLALAEYDSLRAAGRPVLAAGHQSAKP